MTIRDKGAAVGAVIALALVPLVAIAAVRLFGPELGPALGVPVGLVMGAGCVALGMGVAGRMGG